MSRRALPCTTSPIGWRWPRTCSRTRSTRAFHALQIARPLPDALDARARRPRDSEGCTSDAGGGSGETGHGGGAGEERVAHPLRGERRATETDTDGVEDGVGDRRRRRTLCDLAAPEVGKVGALDQHDLDARHLGEE